MFTCPKLRKSLPFRVSIHNSARAFELKIEGPLTEDAVRDVEARWRTGSSILGERAFRVDLGSVASVDAAGRELLGQMRAGGAEFIDSVNREQSHLLQAARDLPALLTCLLSHFRTWAARALSEENP